MKKSICLYFQVHQPTRLRQYRSFDIGKDSHYYDDFADRTILRRIAQRCYIPMNNLLLDLIKQHGGNFKVTFSITGSALEQFERYAPEVLDSFRQLAQTGCVSSSGRHITTLSPRSPISVSSSIRWRSTPPRSRNISV